MVDSPGGSVNRRIGYRSGKTMSDILRSSNHARSAVTSRIHCAGWYA
jgi:hypothetical protein